jgi:hypothetical protein
MKLRSRPDDRGKGTGPLILGTTGGGGVFTGGSTAPLAGFICTAMSSFHAGSELHKHHDRGNHRDVHGASIRAASSCSTRAISARTSRADHREVFDGERSAHDVHQDVHAGDRDGIHARIR